MNEQSIALDVSKRSASFQEIALGLGDHNGTILACSIFDNGSAFDLTGYDCYFEMLLPDGVHMYRQACTVSANVATVVIDERRAASVKGVSKTAYISIEDSGSVITSTNRFTVRVLDSAKDAEPAETWASDLESIIAQYAQLSEAASALMDSMSDLEEDVEAAEALRVTAESARASAETARASAEMLRASAETSRASAESSRASAETARVSAESARATAESGRVSAESARAAAEAQRVAEFALMDQRSKGWLRHYCTTAGTDYDATTRRPIIANPDDATLYYVPVENPTTDNQWVEWQYDTNGNRWEMQGTTEATIDPITTQQIDTIAADGTVTSSNMLNGTGLTYLWSKIKAAFAAITHSHAASTDLTGQVPIANGGTGASTAPAALTALGAAAASHNHSGDALTPASVAATGAVSGSSISDGTGTLAQLRESVSSHCSAIQKANINAVRFQSDTEGINSNYPLDTWFMYSNGDISILRVAVDSGIEFWTMANGASGWTVKRCNWS